jgi:prophage regulatory protein
MTKRFLSVKEALTRVSLSKTHIYYLMARGAFPRPVHLGPKRVAFLESEIEAWMEERIRAREITAAKFKELPCDESVSDA